MVRRHSGGAPVAQPPDNRKAETYNLLRRATVVLICSSAAILLLPLFAALNRASYLAFCASFLAAGVVVRLLQIWFPGRFVFAGFRARALAWWASLERHQQHYVTVALCIPFLAYAYFLDAQNVFRPLLPVFIAACLCIAAYDILRIYRALSETLIGKGLIALVFAVGSTLAVACAGWFIGELTHVAPSTFPHTMSFLSIAMIPILFVLAGAIYIPAAFLIVPFVWLVALVEERAPTLVKWIFARNFERPARRHVLLTLVFQVFFYTFLVTLTPRLLLFGLERHSKEIEAVVAKSIYIFDMYPGTQCKGADGRRTAALGDENYIVAGKEGDAVKFAEPRKCALPDPGPQQERSPG